MGKSCASTEIVAGSCGNIAKADKGRIFKTSENFLDRSVAAYGNDRNRMLLPGRTADAPGKFNSVTCIFGKVFFIGNVFCLQDLAQICPDLFA